MGSTDRYITELLGLTVGWTAAQRGAFLRAVCEADPGIVKPLERMGVFEEEREDDAATAADDPAEDVVAPRRIGPHVLARHIGAGGMGVVYLAWDASLRRKVAVKALAPDPAIDAQQLARLRREARLLASLNHPNIGQIHALEECDGACYVIMEYVDGIGLRDWLRARPTSWADVLRVPLDIARAVEASHEAGVIHRDLKPENVRIASSGMVKVLDFGLAQGCSTGPEHRSSATTQLFTTEDDERAATGTPGYMAPEQIRGEAQDARVDVFSFGCVLYECLAGEPAFPGPARSDRIAAALLKEPHWPLLPDATPQSIVNLMTRCLQKNRDNRPGSMTEVRELLEGELARLRSSEATDKGEQKLVENNLPRELTALVGRDHEKSEIVSRLRSVPLLTLTGTGGAGKTRLALDVAHELLGEFRGGVWLVELASCGSADDVALHVANTIGVVESTSAPLLDLIADRVRNRHSLLVLDNCEHIRSACADFVSRLLRRSSSLTVLATSREPLGVTGEHHFRVPSLEIPSAGVSPNESRGLLEYGAIRLFVERACMVDHEFELNTHNAEAIIDICRALDGIPLAIELAAARVRVMNAGQIRDRLRRASPILKDLGPSRPPRHQTLHASIDWSYRTLDDREQRFFEQMSIFAGGWTLDATETVCSTVRHDAWEVIPPDEVLDVLTGLVDKSLIVCDRHAAGVRYRLLEPLRQFGRAQLRLRGDDIERACRDAHLKCFERLAEDAGRALHEADQSDWIQRLKLDHDNLRAALTFATDPDSGVDSARGVRMAISLHRYWYVHGHFSEGLQWLDRTLSCAGGLDELSRARALNAMGILAWARKDDDRARAAYLECLDIVRRLRDDRRTAAILTNIGLLEETRGAHAAALQSFEEALSLYEKINDERGTAQLHLNTSVAMIHEGQFDRARDSLFRSLEYFRSHQDDYRAATALRNLADLAIRRLQFTDALPYLVESARLSELLDDDRGRSRTLIFAGMVAHHLGQFRRAVELVSAGRARCRGSDDELQPVLVSKIDHILATAAATLSTAEYADAVADGLGLTDSDIIARIEATGQVPDRDASPNGWFPSDADQQE